MVNNVQQDLTGAYFLNQWRLHPKKSDPDMTDSSTDDDEEEVPTELNTVNSSGGYSVVSPDKLSVRYPNPSYHCQDVGAVQANRRAPVKRIAYYFEMYVKNAGAKGRIAIGFTPPDFNMCKQPGWEANSYGYHGDDGMLYHGQGKGDEFGPTYTAGDTVGGGINYARQEFFFTKNGEIVGTVHKGVKGCIFPTIGVHSQNEEVSVNFGKEPFVFDLKAFEAQERAKQLGMVEKMPIPNDASHGLVRSYLLHYGYEDTLNLFDMATHSTIPPITLTQENGFSQEDNYALKQRKIIRELIRSGDIDGALCKLRDWYPQIFQDNTSATSFMLHCQKFIELVRVGKLEEAVIYGRIEFEKFYKLAEYDDLVKDCAALLAYEQPEKSTVGYLLEESQREVVADSVNAMILASHPNMKQASCLHSHLERLLRQLSACFLERRSLNGREGEAFHLCKLLNSPNIV